MSVRFAPFVVAVCLAACSRSGPAQPAPQSGQPEAPAPASTAAPAAAQAAPSPSAPPAATVAATGAAEKSDAATTAAPAPPAANAPAKPATRELIIPAGTALHVRLTTSLASDTSKVEDQVRGRLVSPILVDGDTVVPADAEVLGTVRSAIRSGRVKGRASLSFQFERLIVRSESLAIRTATVSRQAAADHAGDVKKGAIGGAAGAIVGGIIGGGKGAVIGAGVGGAGAVVATRGSEVRLGAETTVQTTLREPLTVTVPRSPER